MNEIQTFAPLPAEKFVREHLPQIFRIQSITRLPGDGRHIKNRAVLFHERASLSVEWVSRQVDVRLQAGCLVSVRWLGRALCAEGALRIARLVRLDRPDPALNCWRRPKTDHVEGWIPVEN